MAVNLAALKTEIQTDPQTYGYAAWVAASEPENVAAALNKVRDGTDGEAAITVRRPDIAPAELLEAIDSRDIAASTSTTAGAYLQALLALPRLRLGTDAGAETRVKQNLDRLINNTQGSQTRFNALATRNGSRAEQLFGPGAIVTIADVQAALALP